MLSVADLTLFKTGRVHYEPTADEQAAATQVAMTIPTAVRRGKNCKPDPKAILTAHKCSAVAHCSA